ncbi:hypothetical protein M758_5G034500 [Ceratodon purpureus]|nr:hypothetical protein M758_5G034500 [Ceratodon purpureus]
MTALSAPPDGALSTSRGFGFRHSMIPRPASSVKRDAEAESSPKSVIADIRFISPGSSSSSSIERRSLPDASHVKSQPRYGRGYSTSDGELSDPDSVLDSTGTSRELGKVGNSGPLESLPETQSLVSEATNADVTVPVERTKPLTAVKRGDGEAPCRIPLFPSANGLEHLELTALYVLADRTNDSGRAQHVATPHSSAALRSDKNDQVDRATPLISTKANNRALPTSASEVPAAGDNDRIEPNSEWFQTATSPESAPEQDGKESANSSARRHTSSESGARRRDYSSRPTFSAELSSSGKPLERGDDTARRSIGPGAAANFGYSGTPLRFFPGWQGPVNSTHAYSPSPKADKGPTTYNLTPSSSDVGLRLQHRFLSGPIMGSMIPKPPPSKWDDADKWIVSPGRKESPTQPHRSLQTLLTGRRHSIAGGQSIRSHHGMGSPDYSTPPGEKPMSSEFQNAFINAGKLDVQKRSISQKKRSKALSFSDISRKFDPSGAVSRSPQPAKREASSQRTKNSPPSGADAQTKSPVHNKSIKLNEQPLLAHNVLEGQEKKQVEYSVDNPEMAESMMKTSSDAFKDSQVPKHPPLVLKKESSTVSGAAEPLQETTICKDMGTQMTPVESLKNSTCTTPGLAVSPTRHCNTPAGRRASSLGAIPMAVDLLELQGCHLAKLELRQLVGDDQPSLERKSIWTTREEEEMESSASLREDPEDLDRCQLGTKATAWEEAEHSKALIRFQNKEAKIRAWEEHQRVQAEADMKKVEAKVEKILEDANEKKKDKLASAAKKAAEMRAAAELVRSQQAAKIAVRAELMRKAGLLSPSKSSFRSCFRILRS